MADITGKGLTKLEKIRDYFPPEGQYSSVKMRQKYLLQEVQKDPNFSIEPSSILRPDWDKLVGQGLITDSSYEEECTLGDHGIPSHMTEY